MRIEKRKIESSKELRDLTVEALDGEIEGLAVLEDLPTPDEDLVIALLCTDGKRRHFVVLSSAAGGDDLISLYGKEIDWIAGYREVLMGKHPGADFSGEPGLVMLAESFGKHTLLIASMLDVEPRRCYSLKCLGMGGEKGLYLEEIALPQRKVVVREKPAEGDLLSRTISSLLGIAEGISVSASFGYLSKSLDWVPVANLRSHRGTIWVESGPGTWSAKRIDDETSLRKAVERVRKSYEEVVKTKGEAKPGQDDDLTEEERRSLNID